MVVLLSAEDRVPTRGVVILSLLLGGALGLAAFVVDCKPAKGT